MDQPNILYLHSHDTGRYIQPYGHAIPTPHLQRLAEQGVQFRQAFCAAPTCSPSRASLVTGRWPHNNGMLGLAHRGFRLNDYGHHIIHSLRRAGYTSALAGVQHVARPPEAKVDEIGYDRVLSAEPGNTGRITACAVDFLGGAQDRPFFLSVGYHLTHRAFPPPGPQEDPRYSLPPAPFPDTPETREDTASFKACARMLDEQMGAVLQALDGSNLADNTLVVCTTDHGIAFPGMKCDLTDHGIGVFLILRGPGGFTGGTVCDAMVTHMDIFPTVCDLLGIDPPAWLQGSSIVPLISGEADRIHDEIFAEINYHSYYDPQRAIRTPRWKYIRHYHDGERPGDLNCDPGLCKDFWLEYGWRDRPLEQERLYDLVFDPGETHNVARDPFATPVLNNMRRRMDRWMEDTDDPLLQGQVQAPPGVRIDDPSDLPAVDPWRTGA